MRYQQICIFIFAFFGVLNTYSQATFTSGSTASDMAVQITGPGVTISNPLIVNGASTQVGTYSNGIAGAGLQLDSGIILTTGTVTESFSINNDTGISLGPGTIFSDADLTAIDPNATRDVVVFQFEAVLDPLATVLTIDYQFMSDEYNEYVCSTFNDVFGYFISGPGITGTQNIALVPGTSNPVTIASINNGTVGAFGNVANCVDLTQSASFTDNTAGGITMEYDGITTKLRATATGLTPGATYTVKFAIADVSDGAFDTAILIDVISGFADDDEDGIANDQDLDDDNDGILDTEEDDNLDNDNNPLSNPTDTDSDGIPNYLDLDSDNDGIPDNIEAQSTNGYIAPGTFTDTNLDGVNDIYAGGITPVNTDGTGNPDYLDTDSDDDGTNDQTESGVTLSGNVGNNGLDNGLEAIDDYSDVNGTLNDPTTLPDADGDLGTGGDVDYRDAITLGDNDGDGIDDITDLDDDNDGILDTIEDASADGDSDGIPNRLDLDSDGDGIPDNIEAQTTSGYIPPGVFTDGNGDGVNDVYAGGLTPVNTDGTDNQDYLDTDSDNEGADDTTEASLTLSGIVSTNGLDTAIATSANYDDVNGTIDDPTTLPDSDSDVGGGGDVDFRDDTVDITLGSGNLLWLRSDIEATSSLWQDQSGNDHDATSGTTADPALSNNAINFYPAFDFNGSTQGLMIPGGVLGNDSYTGAWVYIVSSTDVVKNSFTFYESITSSERLGCHIPWGDGNLYFDFGNISPIAGRIQSPWGSSINTFNLWNFGNSNTTVNPSSSNKSLYRDGLLFASDNTFDPTLQGNSQDFLIGEFAGNFYDGKIAELIIFADVPTSLEQQKVQSYLAIKYGITLDTTDNDSGAIEGDYIASDETTKYWDFTANSTYHNDVAGIGRDDTQVLNHKQSKSASSDRIITIGLGSIAADNASNTNTFNSDKDFLAWGNDNVTLGATSTSGILCATDLRLNRNWKIVETGSVGTVQIAAPKSTIDTYLTNTNRSKALIIADDASYTTNVEFVALTEQTIDGETQYAGTFDFDGTKFFTFVEVGGITWSGSSSSWSGGQGTGGAPSTNALDNNELLTIDSEGTSNHATLPENAQVGCVWVTAGSKLIVPSGQFLQIADQLFLEGEIRLIGSAQLVQTHVGTSQVTGSGKLYIDQQGTVETIYRYNYWTSPVNSTGTGYTVEEVMKDGTIPTSETSAPPNINFTNGLDGALTTPITISNYWIYGYLNGLSQSNWIQQFETGTFEVPEGYLLKGPGAQQNYTFVGTPNDGSYTSFISSGFLSLLGNPYPSALDSQQFFADNLGVVETLYFWEHLGDSGNHNLAGYIGGYGLLNESMSIAGVAPSNDTTGGQGGLAYTAPGRYIPIGQGFFVSADGTGTVTFNNSQRIFELENEDGGSDSVFFRNNSSDDIPDTNEENLPILKLGLDFINDDGVELHRQIGISFKEGHKFTKETGYDSPIFDLNSTDLYFSFEGARENLVVAGIQEITDDLEFPIALQIGNSNDVTIRIDEEYHIDRDIFLEDKVTSQVHDLSNPITISVPIGTYTDRFYIKFGQVSLSNDQVIEENISIFMNQDTEELIIKSTQGLDVKKVIIYNLLGQVVKEFENGIEVIDQRTSLTIDDLSTGIYGVTVLSSRGKANKKIVKQ